MALSNAGHLMDFLFKESLKKTEFQKINDLRVSVVEIETLVATLHQIVHKHRDDNLSAPEGVEDNHLLYLESTVRKLEQQIASVSVDVDRKVSTLLATLSTVAGVGGNTPSSVLGADIELLMSFRTLPTVTDSRVMSQKSINDFTKHKTTVVELLSYILFGEARTTSSILPGPIGSSITLKNQVKSGNTVTKLEFEFCYPVIFQSVLGTLPELAKLRVYALDITSETSTPSLDNFLQLAASKTSLVLTLATLKKLTNFNVVVSGSGGVWGVGQNEYINFDTGLITQVDHSSRKYLVALGTIDTGDNLNSLSNLVEITIERKSAPDIFTSPAQPTIDTITEIAPVGPNLIEKLGIHCNVGGEYAFSTLTRDVVGSGTTTTQQITKENTLGVLLESANLLIRLTSKFNFVDGITYMDETQGSFVDDVVEIVEEKAVSDFNVDRPRHGRGYRVSVCLKNNKSPEFSAKSVEKEFDGTQDTPQATMFETLHPLSLYSSSVKNLSALHLGTLASHANVVSGDDVSGGYTFGNLTVPFLNKEEYDTLVKPARDTAAKVANFLSELNELFKTVSMEILIGGSALLSTSLKAMNIRSQVGAERAVLYNDTVESHTNNAYGKLSMKVANVDSYLEADKQKFFNEINTQEMTYTDTHKLQDFDRYRIDGLYSLEAKFTFGEKTTTLPLCVFEPKSIHRDGLDLRTIRTGGAPVMLDNFPLTYDIFDISATVDNLKIHVGNKIKVICGYPIFNLGCIPWTVSYSGYNETYGVNPMLSYSIKIGAVNVGEDQADMGSDTLYKYNSETTESATPSEIYTSASKALELLMAMRSENTVVTVHTLKTIKVVHPERALIGLLDITNTYSFKVEASGKARVVGTEKTSLDNSKYNSRYSGCGVNRLKAGICKDSYSSEYLGRPIRFALIKDIDATTGDIFANGEPGNQYVIETRATNLSGDSTTTQIPITNKAFRIDSKSIAYGEKIVAWNSTAPPSDTSDRPAKVLMSYSTIRETLSMGKKITHEESAYTHQLVLSQGKWTHTNHRDFPSYSIADCDNAGNILFGSYGSVPVDKADTVQSDFSGKYEVMIKERTKAVDLMKARSGEGVADVKHVTFVFENILGDKPADTNYIKVYSKDLYDTIDTSHSRSDSDDFSINIKSSDVDVIVGFIKKEGEGTSYTLLSQLYNAKGRSDEVPVALNDQSVSHVKMASLAASYAEQNFGDSSTQYARDVIKDGDVVADNLRGIRPADVIDAATDNLVNFAVEKPIDLVEACDMFVRVQLRASNTADSSYNPSKQIQIGHLYAASFVSSLDVTF